MKREMGVIYDRIRAQCESFRYKLFPFALLCLVVDRIAGIENA